MLLFRCNKRTKYIQNHEVEAHAIEGQAVPEYARTHSGIERKKTHGPYLLQDQRIICSPPFPDQ